MYNFFFSLWMFEVNPPDRRLLQPYITSGETIQHNIFLFIILNDYFNSKQSLYRKVKIIFLHNYK